MHLTTVALGMRETHTHTHTHTHTERLMRLSKNHIESGVLVLNYYKFFLFKNIHFPELCMEKD